MSAVATQRSCSLQERLVGSFSSPAHTAASPAAAAAPIEVPTIDQVSLLLAGSQQLWPRCAMFHVLVYLSIISCSLSTCNQATAT